MRNIAGSFFSSVSFGYTREEKHGVPLVIRRVSRRSSCPRLSELAMSVALSFYGF